MKNTRFNILINIIYKLCKKHPKVILMMICETFFLVIEPFFGIILPALVIQMIVQKLAWSQFVINIILLFLCYGIINAGKMYFSSRNETQYIFPRVNLFLEPLLKKTQDLKYDYYESGKAQENIEQALKSVVGNANTGSEGIMHSLPILISCFISLVIYACFISKINLIILIILLLLSVISYFIYGKFFALYLKKDQELAENYEIKRYFDTVIDDKEKQQDIRLYQMQNQLMIKMQKNNTDAIKKSLTALKYKQMIPQVNVLFGFIRDAITYGYLIFLMYQYELDISSFVFYLGIVLSYGQRFTTLATCISNMNSNLDISKRWYTFMDDKNIVDQSGIEIETIKDIVFEDVSFQYPNSDKKVLEHFNLHFKNNEKLALVGTNGAGKTTIVKLISGLYTPTEGRILINGIDLRKINKKKYYQKVGVIFQEINTFSFTIGENISNLEEGKYDEKKVYEALKIAHLDTYVNSLKKGIHSYLEHVIDEQGIDLSGGQKQRLLLAKVYYKNPDLLILDEPTSALDAIAEKELYNEYEKITKGKSSLYISHRLASTRFCDRILLLEDGKVVEEGSHQSLIAKNGKYAEMFKIQAKYYQEEKHELV